MDQHQQRDNNEATRPHDSVDIHLPHVEQSLSWDCGVSCVAMVLPDDQRSYLLVNRDQISQEEGYHQSTWTIDLCYLLRRFGVDHLYATVTLGVNPMFQKECYYKKSLQWDFQRVEDRFRDAASNGLAVCQKSTTTGELLEHLSRGLPVIVLVDHGQLHCDSCQKNRIVSKVAGVFARYAPYQGHYIVLCGYRLQERRFIYRNPSKTERLCTVTFETLDRARKRLGTDEDVVFVNACPPSGCVVRS
ncbi:protein GUCD1 [Amblyomma americanum]|uniref:Guanylylate cyclase n=1 Tax=Amblyomma americanum TaxID=6943 RepID=A0AAQ4FRZ3_AMBAM